MVCELEEKDPVNGNSCPDAEELRAALEDYYGTAMASGMPFAAIELSKVENMSAEELEEEIEKCHLR